MVESKIALITGITGQDGAYLAQFLLKKGYEVHGAFRRISTPNFWRLEELNIKNDIHFIPIDMIDHSSIFSAIKDLYPDEVYHLAAQSFVGASFDVPDATANITGLGTLRMLETIRQVNPDIRFYQASTSELYGNCSTLKSPLKLNEYFRFLPTSPYAAAKLYAYHLTKIYREGYGLFACNGILFNHESPLRGLEFVTRKISNAVAKISLGLEDKLALGNPNACRDWGYAPEYVESMWMMLQKNFPDDYVIATGETHSVLEFAKTACDILDLDFENRIVWNSQNFMRPVDTDWLCGDASKAYDKLGWFPSTKFEELVRIMVEEDVERWRKWTDGERMKAWDAIL